MAVLEIPSQFLPFTDGQSRLALEGSTVREVLEAAVDKHEGLGNQLFNSRGELRRFIYIFAGHCDVSERVQLDTVLAPDDGLFLVRAVAGG